jgi:hypothetical protein
MKMNLNPAQKNLITTFKGTDKYIAKFIKLQESEADLSMQRIGQELLTNTLPKSLFARSIVDLCDNAFREILENIIVYLGPKFVGENLFRKAYSSNLGKNLGDEVATTAAERLNKIKILEGEEKSKLIEDNKTLMPVKAAIAVAALAIPIAEYSLSFVKNLFTLKMFKQSDFNNIANLNKEKNESTQHQGNVKSSAKKHIKIAGAVLAGCLGFSALLATKGKNSTILNHFSEFILAPGSKTFKNDENIAKFFDKYFGLDFKNKNGKLALSNGQITACVTAGFFGYTGAAKDRGKQDYKEVLYRFPLVGFYAISGNELFTKGFKSLMKKTGKCKELFAIEEANKKIKEEIKKEKDKAPKDEKIKAKELIKNEMPTLKDLEEQYAKKLELAKGTPSEAALKAEFKKLFNQKTLLTGAPVLFGFTVMGLFVASCSRFFTQYRFNKDKQQSGNRM